MKNNLIMLCLILPLVGIGQSKKQKRLQGEIHLTKEIMKECGYHRGEDSLYILETIQMIHRVYKVNEVRFVHNGTGSSHFIYPSRKMHLFTQNSLSDSFCISELWIGELPHAKQFRERPLYSSWKALKGFVQALFDGLFLKKSERKDIKELVTKGCPRLNAWYWVSYRRQYKRPGTFEYEAHSDIEPQLKIAVSYLLAR